MWRWNTWERRTKSTSIFLHCSSFKADISLVSMDVLTFLWKWNQMAGFLRGTRWQPAPWTWQKTKFNTPLCSFIFEAHARLLLLECKTWLVVQRKGRKKKWADYKVRGWSWVTATFSICTISYNLYKRFVLSAKPFYATSLKSDTTQTLVNISSTMQLWNIRHK